MRTQLPPNLKRLTLGAALAASAVIAVHIGFVRAPQLMQSHEAAQSVAIAAAATSAPAPGTSELSVFDQPRALPEIRFADEEGHDLTLADFRGRVVLLNLWATWCVPCRKEMPALDRLQARLGGDEFLVIPLSIDRGGVAAVKRFYQEIGIERLGIYVDPSGRGSRGLAIPGLPTTLLIDRQGREVARKMGAAEWDGPEMVSLIRRTIEAPSGQTGNRDR